MHTMTVGKDDFDGGGFAICTTVQNIPALLQRAKEIMQGLRAIDQGIARAEALLDDTTDDQNVEARIGHARRTIPSGNEGCSLTAGGTELVALVEGLEGLEDMWKEMTRGV